MRTLLASLSLLLLATFGVGSAFAQAQAAGAARQALISDGEWAELNDVAAQRVAPFRVFDNLYYVGTKWVSAWLLTTSEGHVLIDSLYGDLAGLALDGVRQLGFEPKEIRYVLVTHGHFDHAGGAKRIQKATGARVGMTAIDWEMVEEDPRTEVYSFEPPARDLVVSDGDVITVGDTAIRCYVTPGHTPGVLSLTFPVKDGEATHQALVFGGVGLNFSGVERTEAYLASVRRLQQLPGLEVKVTNHPDDALLKHSGAFAERRPGTPHPLVSSKELRDWLIYLEADAVEKLVAENKAADAG